MSAQTVPLDRPVLTSSSVCLGSWMKKTSSAAPKSSQRMFSLMNRSGPPRGGAPLGVSEIDAASIGLLVEDGPVPDGGPAEATRGAPARPVAASGHGQDAPCALSTLSNT